VLGLELEVKVKAVVKDKKNNHIVLLQDEAGTKILPIWIGTFEARSIARAVYHEESSRRPQSHDLIKILCEQLEGEVKKIVIKDISQEGTYFAELHLQTGTASKVIDSRPSDAVALALRFGAPVFISFKLVEFTINPENLHIQNPDGEDNLL